MQYRPEPLRERDKYRGRRRIPSPPRSRYVGVVATAIVGAGIVALGAGAAMPNAKADAGARDGADNTSQAALDRAAAADAASRSERSAGLNSSVAAAPDAWVLPLHDYEFTSGFGGRWGTMHNGVDLAVPEGTPYSAIHDGTVIVAAWRGACGNTIMIDHGDGIVSVYCHSLKLNVKVGDKVKAGQQIGWTGNTGHSTGPHLHLEIHDNGTATDPVPWLKAHGVDLKLEMESVY